MRHTALLVAVGLLMALSFGCNDELEGNVPGNNATMEPDPSTEPVPNNQPDACNGECKEDEVCITREEGPECNDACDDDDACEKGERCIDGGCFELLCDPLFEECVCEDEADPTTCVPLPPEIQVEIAGGGYNPAFVTIPPGGTVTWTNTDDTLRSASCNECTFDAELSQGESFSFTFEELGTFVIFERFGAGTGQEMQVKVE